MVAQGREDGHVGEILLKQGCQPLQQPSLIRAGLVPDVVSRQVSCPQDVVKLQQSRGNMLRNFMCYTLWSGRSSVDKMCQTATATVKPSTVFCHKQCARDAVTVQQRQ